MKVRLAALALVAAAACSGTDPVPSITGSWDFIGYQSDGATATTVSGTAVFSAAGSVTFNGTIQFPGEPLETISETAQFTQSGNSLTLTTPTDTSEWELTFSGNDVVLQLLNDASASRLTLRRT